MQCLVIDRLDTVHALQTRISRSPAATFISADFDLLRSQLRGLNETTTLDAINSHSGSAQGAAFLRLLQDTENLLQIARMGNPDSITQHFTQKVRSNLATVSRYLTDLRCSDDAIRIARYGQDQTGARETEETLDNAAAIVWRMIAEILDLTNLFLLMGAVVCIVFGTHVTRQMISRSKRRAKRQTSHYSTSYQIKGKTRPGTLLDINCFGTKLKHAEQGAIPAGSESSIKIGDDWVPGIIAWTNAHYAGVQFKRAISLAAVTTVCETKSPPPQTQNGAQKDAA